MLQVILDDLMFGMMDVLAGNALSPWFVLLLVIVVGGTAFGIYAVIMNIRYNEARQTPTQTIVNVPPSMTGPYIVVGIIVLIAMFVLVMR